MKSHTACGGAATSMLIGIVLGVTAGYFRGWWDDLVVWLVTTLNSIPALFLLLIAIGAALAYSIAGSGNSTLASGLNDFSWGTGW